MEICGRELVEEVKKRVTEVKGIPSDQFYLSCDGKLLEEEKMLLSYLIPQRSHLQVNLLFCDCQE